MTALRVAIIGGGPGGLMTAYRLEQKHPFLFDVTLFEGSPRLGGKVWTPRFSAADLSYEAGAAELYDYTHLGPDPLRELIAELGLSTRPMGGNGVFLANRLVTDNAALRRVFGDAASEALARFEETARSKISPAEYYESDWRADNEDPMSQVTFQHLLDSLPDADARRYIEVAIHSDLATEPDLTSATYGQQNWLMNHPDYMRLYTIEGGLERLPRELARRLRATNIRLSQPVISVEPLPNGEYLVRSQTRQGINESTFDFVVAALPNNWISAIEWRGASLSRAMRQHVAHYRHPAHYLRVSLLYDYPFWREQIADSYFMIDAFGGCCVYDESARHGDGVHGILGMLIAGESALTMGNLDDARLVEMARRALPAVLGESSAEMLEAKVHRWLGAVSALPGGRLLADPDSRHIPDPVAHPWLFVVGDYLFDTTLNGVLDSADTVVEMLAEEEQDFRASGAAEEAEEDSVERGASPPEPVLDDAPMVGRIAMSPLGREQDVS